MAIQPNFLKKPRANMSIKRKVVDMTPPSIEPDFSILDRPIAEPVPETFTESSRTFGQSLTGSDPGFSPQGVQKTMDKLAMGRKIVDFEARRDRDGNLMVYNLPKSDGGGSTETAGINEKYHPEKARELANLIAQGKSKEAEEIASDYIASYTDPVTKWTQNPAIEFYLRDTAFNRGPGGAAKILQKALGVKEDGAVGPITLEALKHAETNPEEFLNALRSSREAYEDEVAGARPEFRKGLINRWDNALDYSKSLLQT